MNTHIRQAKLSDIPQIHNVCLKTGFSGEDATPLVRDKYLLGKYFAEPYLQFEIDSCFVITEQFTPQGYIVGTSSTEAFNKWMNKSWLPKLRKQYPSTLHPTNELEKFLLDLIHRNCINPSFLDNYPAHLHIDLLPQMQGRGLGKKMMIHFFDLLKSKGVPGCHLSLGARNTKALEFYERMGFSVLETPLGAVVMGIKL